MGPTHHQNFPTLLDVTGLQSSRPPAKIKPSSTTSNTNRSLYGPERIRLHPAKMSDGGDIEVENTVVSDVLPKDVTKEIGNVKLFNKWDYDVEVRDISLTYVRFLSDEALSDGILGSDWL